jgi:hypothetical protein
VGNLTNLAADVVSADYGLGSPRFSVEVSNGTTTKSIFVYLGDLPNLNRGAQATPAICWRAARVSTRRSSAGRSTAPGRPGK